MNATLRSSRDQDVPALNEALAEVIREREFLGTLHPPSLERMQNFCRRLHHAGVGQLLAELDGQIIGWCDASRSVEEGFRHNATLGMGVRKQWRGMGIGSRLLEAMLARCEADGIERVELSVYATNAPAIRLYERFGFEREGVRRKQRCLDGHYYDVVMMAKFLRGSPS